MFNTIQNIGRTTQVKGSDVKNLRLADRHHVAAGGGGGGGGGGRHGSRVRQGTVPAQRHFA